MKYRYTYGEKIARKGHKKAFYKVNFISEHTLVVILAVAEQMMSWNVRFVILCATYETERLFSLVEMFFLVIWYF